MKTKPFNPNPATGCKDYDVTPPTGAGYDAGCVTEISEQPLSTESVDLCAHGWEKHLAHDGGLRIKSQGQQPVDNSAEIDSLDSFAGINIGDCVTMTKETGYGFGQHSQTSVEVTNQHLFDQLSKAGKDVVLEVTFIMKDPEVGHVIFFTVIK